MLLRSSYDAPLHSRLIWLPASPTLPSRAALRAGYDVPLRSSVLLRSSYDAPLDSHLIWLPASPTLPEGRCDLINFIAIEPVVNGMRGFSELERSEIDEKQGRMIWAGESVPARSAPPLLVLSQRSDSPGELRFAGSTAEAEANEAKQDIESAAGVGVWGKLELRRTKEES